MLFHCRKNDYGLADCLCAEGALVLKLKFQCRLPYEKASENRLNYLWHMLAAVIQWLLDDQ